jgi:hypothetical protein
MSDADLEHIIELVEQLSLEEKITVVEYIMKRLRFIFKLYSEKPDIPYGADFDSEYP